MIKKILLLFLFCSPILCYAQSSFNIKTLADFQNSGNSAQAYQYALQFNITQEGNPDYDYYFGMAAIDTGNVSQGVFALERVLLVQADHHAARLELARAYFLLEEYGRSKQEFTSMLELQPPADVRAKIQSYLDAIHAQEGRYTTTSGLTLRIGTGTDDNVSSAPPSFDVFPSVFGFRITGDSDSPSIQQEDSYSEYNLAYQIDIPFAVGWSFSTELDTEGKLHQEYDVLDTSHVRANLGINLLSKNDRYRLLLGGQNFKVDGEDYRQSTNVGLDWRKRLSAQSQLQFFLQGDVLDYEDQDTRNSTVSSFGVGYLKEFSANLAPLLFFNIYLGDENPEIKSRATAALTEREFNGASVGLQISLSSRWALTSSYSLQQSHYADFDPLELPMKKRDDSYSTLKLELNWIVGKSWNIQTAVSMSDNNSNIDRFTYERTQIGLNLRRAFAF